MDVDGMLALSGDMGRYQYLMMALFSIINVLSSFHYFAQTFISIEPAHWCAGSGLECMEPDLNDSMRACSSGWQYNLTGGFSTAVSEVGTVFTHENSFDIENVCEGSLISGLIFCRIDVGLIRNLSLYGCKIYMTSRLPNILLTETHRLLLVNSNDLITLPTLRPRSWLLS